MYLQGHWRELIGIDVEEAGKERLKAIRERLVDSALENLESEGIQAPVVNRAGGGGKDSVWW